MNLNESNAMMGKLAGMFPTATSEQTSAAGREFRKYAVKTVTAAIEEHAKRSEFLRLPDLFKACEEAEKKPDASTTRTAPAVSFADAIRARDEQLRPVESDIEVIIRSHRKQWHAAGQRGQYRESIRRQCAMALCGLPLDGRPLCLDDAGKWAETIFGDVDYFRDVLDDLRTRHNSGKASELLPTPEWKLTLDGIRDHFESAWKHVKSGAADAHGKAVAQATIFRHAVMALADLRIDDQAMPQDEIVAWALAFIGLEPGQRVAWPEAKFGTRIKVQEPQSSFEAIAALARNEEAQKALPAPDPVAVGSSAA